VDRALATQRAALAEVRRRRDAVWDLHLSGRVRAEDVQEKLDVLAAERDELETRIATLAAERSAAQARRVDARDARATVRNAARTYADASLEDRRLIARAIALLFGGLCLERDDTLALRRAEDAKAQRARKAAER
jgi:hypothetical protein